MKSNTLLSLSLIRISLTISFPNENVVSNAMLGKSKADMSSLGCYLLYTHILQCTPASLGLIIPPASAAVLREGRGGEESPGGSGGTARHYRLPKQQQALLNPMCNNPATTVPGLFFLSRNWFVPCGLVAFLCLVCGFFSFRGVVGENVPD